MQTHVKQTLAFKQYCINIPFLKLFSAFLTTHVRAQYALLPSSADDTQVERAYQSTHICVSKHSDHRGRDTDVSLEQSTVVLQGF